MKTVKLTDYECQVIIENLSEYDICAVDCYCGYKTDMCNKLDEEGDYRCKLIAAIGSIKRKLGEEV